LSAEVSIWQYWEKVCHFEFGKPVNYWTQAFFIKTYFIMSIFLIFTAVHATSSIIDSSIWMDVHRFTGIYREVDMEIEWLTDAEFEQRFANRQLEWGEAVADLAHRKMVLRQSTPANQLIPIMKHEYFHLLMSQCCSPIPLWFNEGMAQLAGQRWEPPSFWTLLFQFPKQASLRYYFFIQSYPQSASKRRMAYFLWHEAGLYLRESHDIKKLYQLFFLLEKKVPFEQAFMNVYQQSLPIFLQHFWAFEKRKLLLHLLTHPQVFGAVMLLLLSIGWIRVKLRNRKKLQKWQQIELTDSQNDLLKPTEDSEENSS